MSASQGYCNQVDVGCCYCLFLLLNFLLKLENLLTYLIPVFGIFSAIVNFNLLDSFCFGGFVFA